MYMAAIVSLSCAKYIVADTTHNNQQILFNIIIYPLMLLVVRLTFQQT